MRLNADQIENIVSSAVHNACETVFVEHAASVETIGQLAAGSVQDSMLESIYRKLSAKSIAKLEKLASERAILVSRIF